MWTARRRCWHRPSNLRGGRTSCCGIGFYLQMVLAPQEIVMGLWLVIQGFNPVAIAPKPAYAA
jgi:hypothetical protein